MALASAALYSVQPLSDAEIRGAVADLRTVFGARQIATICRVTPGTVNSWAQGKSTPNERVTWLRLAYLHDAMTEVQKQDYLTVGGWFASALPAVANAGGASRTPWQLLSDFSIETTGPIVFAAAKNLTRAN